MVMGNCSFTTQAISVSATPIQLTFDFDFHDWKQLVREAEAGAPWATSLGAVLLRALELGPVVSTMTELARRFGVTRAELYAVRHVLKQQGRVRERSVGKRGLMFSLIHFATDRQQSSTY